MDVSFHDVIDSRVSVRAFTEDPVPESHLRNALHVARLAPSAGNLQAYQVVIVRDAEQKLDIGRASARQTWIATAPVVLVFLADLDRSGIKYGDRGRSLYAVQDATIAAAYTQLALEAAGLSSCWVGAFQEDLVAEAVGAPYVGRNPHPIGATDDKHDASSRSPSRGLLRPVVVMPVGVAAERSQRHRRRAVSEFVHQDHYATERARAQRSDHRSTVNKKHKH